eukprot:sb/3460672/
MVRRRERERERHRQRERQINITLQGVEVKSGTPATLTCTVSNLESDVTITWEKDSVVMESGASGVTMTTDIKQSGGSQQSVLVVDAPVTDAVYTCKVVEGSGYMTADVNVYDVTVSDFEVVSGSTISLTCDVTDHSGGMKITWKDSSGTQLGTNTAQPSLVTVVTPSGSGTYTCETESTWKSSSPVCSTTANVYTYRSVLNSDQISTFTKDVAPETTGQVTYTCSVKSKALPNSSSHEEILNLWTYDVSLQHREVIVGSTVTLMVSISGVPSSQPIKVTWTGQSENDVTVANGNGDTVISKLTVGEASAMDVGVTVESVNHPASTVYTGNVKLETFNVSGGNVLVTSGSTATLTCTVDQISSDPVVITWAVGGVQITEGITETEFSEDFKNQSSVLVTGQIEKLTTYECNVKSTLYTESPPQKKLITATPFGITVSNREVPVGTEVILTCSVSGFSGTPTLEWTLGNQKLTSGDTYKITGETQGGAFPNPPFPPPDVSLQHREVIVGSTVTLMVSVSGVPSTQPIKVAWTGQSENDVTVANGNGDTVISKLTVGEASAMDVGVTVESVNHPASTVYTGNVKLETFNVSGGNVLVTSGSTATLTCTVDQISSDPVVITWAVGGVQITEGITETEFSEDFKNQSSVLVTGQIEKLTTYECNVKSTLYTESPPQKKLITATPFGITVSNREVPVGTEVILTCSVSGFSGTPTLEWTLGNQKLTSGDTYKITGETQGGAVHLSYITLTAPNNDMTFTCRVKSAGQTDQTETAAVYSYTVESESYDVPVGEPSTIRCSINHPLKTQLIPKYPANSSKYHPINTLCSTPSKITQGADHTLELTVAKADSDTDINCVVIVTDEPPVEQVVPIKTYTAVAKGASIKGGETATLSCSVTGQDDNLALKWMQGEGVISDGVETVKSEGIVSTLTFQPTFEKTYTCRVEGEDKSYDFEAPLEINDLELAPAEDIRAFNGQEVTLTCNYISSTISEGNFQWLYQDEECTTCTPTNTPKSSTLVVSVSDSTAGSWRCGYTRTSNNKNIRSTTVSIESVAVEGSISDTSLWASSGSTSSTTCTVPDGLTHSTLDSIRPPQPAPNPPLFSDEPPVEQVVPIKTYTAVAKGASIKGGETATLSCSVTGQDDNLALKWMQGEGVISDGVETVKSEGIVSTLTFQPTFEKTYTCRVEGEDKSYDFEAPLEINDLELAPAEDIRAFNGQEVTLTCNYISSTISEGNFQWLYQDEECTTCTPTNTPKSSTLVVSVSDSTAGSWRCGYTRTSNNKNIRSTTVSIESVAVEGSISDTSLWASSGSTSSTTCTVPDGLTHSTLDSIRWKIDGKIVSSDGTGYNSDNGVFEISITNNTNEGTETATSTTTFQHSVSAFGSLSCVASYSSGETVETEGCYVNMQRMQGLSEKIYLAPESTTTTTVTYQAKEEGTLTCTIDQSAAAVVSSTTNSDLGNGKLQLFTVSITPPSSLDARVDDSTTLSSPSLSLTCVVDSLSVSGLVKVVGQSAVETGTVWGAIGEKLALEVMFATSGELGAAATWQRSDGAGGWDDYTSGTSIVSAISDSGTQTASLIIDSLTPEDKQDFRATIDLTSVSITTDSLTVRAVTVACGELSSAFETEDVTFNVDISGEELPAKVVLVHEESGSEVEVDLTGVSFSATTTVSHTLTSVYSTQAGTYYFSVTYSSGLTATSDTKTLSVLKKCKEVSAPVNTELQKVEKSGGYDLVVTCSENPTTPDDADNNYVLLDSDSTTITCDTTTGLYNSDYLSPCLVVVAPTGA